MTFHSFLRRLGGDLLQASSAVVAASEQKTPALPRRQRPAENMTISLTDSFQRFVAVVTFPPTANIDYHGNRPTRQMVELELKKVAEGVCVADLHGFGSSAVGLVLSGDFRIVV